MTPMKKPRLANVKTIANHDFMKTTMKTTKHIGFWLQRTIVEPV